MVYVITGGPGFGKTTMIDLLGKRGFPVCLEGARALISPKENQTERIDSVTVPVDFEQKVAYKRIDFLNSAAQNTIAFSDRGLPDQIAYSWHKNKIPSVFIEEAVLANRYAPFVFVVPPWEAIFTKDEIRKESFAEATEIHGQIVRAYRKYGYKIVVVPLERPELRVKFILDFLGI